MQLTRWLESTIDYGPNYHRATRLYDSSLACARVLQSTGRYQRTSDDFNHACQQSKRIPNPNAPTINAISKAVLCDHRSGELRNMQREMESVTSSAVSRNFFDIASAAEVAALVDKREESDALARHGAS